MIYRTVLTTDAVEAWLARHALVGLKARFTSPDYKFVLERTVHVQNTTCLPHIVRVHIVCETHFSPVQPLVDAWRGKTDLR